MPLTVYTSPTCLLHKPGTGHPECPDRLVHTIRALRSSHFTDQLEWKEAPLADRALLSLAHSKALIDQLYSAVPKSGLVALDGDTLMSPHSLEAARYATGAICLAVDDLLAENCDSAFCATRPPGHHATQDTAMGFCLLNHVAIAALYARSKGLSRVAVVDFDVHHGNGSQDIFEGEEGILYISTHQSPLYPGSGTTQENQPGNILNLPLPSATDGATYREVFQTKAIPAIDEFRPELILVSAGFDAHKDDPLANLALSAEDYQWLGSTLKSSACAHANGRLAAVLEGGYDLNALAASVTAFVHGLLLQH